MRRFLLDTGVLLGFIRKAEWAERVSEELNLDSKEAIIFTSIICVGELLALSEKLGGAKARSLVLKRFWPNIQHSILTIRVYYGHVQ